MDFAEGQWNSITYHYYEGTTVIKRSVGINSWWHRGDATPDDVLTLQAIYASDDKFQNNNNDPEPFVVTGLPLVSNLDDLIPQGYDNPLVPTSKAAYLKKQRALADYTQVSRSANSDGLVTHVEEIGKVPGLTSSDRSTQTVVMDEWIAGFGGGTNNPPPIFTHEYIREDGVTDANATDQVEYKALWALLQSIKQSGDDIPADGPDLTDEDFDASNPLPGRTFRFTPAGGTPQTFTVGTVSFTAIENPLFPGETFITALSIVINVTTGTYDTDSYTRWLQSQIVTIGAIANSMRPLSGSYQVPHRQREVLLPNGLKLVVKEGLVYHQQPDGSEMPTIGNTGKEMFHQTLPLRTGGGWTIHPEPEFTVITVIGSSNSALYWPNPVELVSPGQAREIVIQNIGTGTCTIYDSSNARRLTLGPGQWALWRLTRPPLGTTARNILAQVSDRRRHTMIGGIVGNLANGRYTEFDSTHWFRPMYNPETPAHNDPDGFSAGGSAYTFNAGATFASVTNWFQRGSVRLEASGELIFYQAVELKVEGGVSGTLPSGSEARLYRQPGGTGTPALLGTPNTYQEISGSRDVQTMTWLYVGPILEDDVLFAGLRYAKAGGLNPGDVDIVNFTRIALLRPDIVISS